MNTPSREVEIRQMRAEDLESVQALAAGLDNAPHWPQQAYVTAFDPQATPRRIALVAVSRQSAAVIGFAIASLLPPLAELETVAVAATAQRQGIGRKLLQALIGEVQAAASELLLEVRSSNQTAQGLYRSLGWRQTGLRPRYYTDPVEDAVLMSLNLD